MRYVAGHITISSPLLEQTLADEAWFSELEWIATHYDEATPEQRARFDAWVERDGRARGLALMDATKLGEFAAQFMQQLEEDWPDGVIRDIALVISLDNGSDSVHPERVDRRQNLGSKGYV